MPTGNRDNESVINMLSVLAEPTRIRILIIVAEEGALCAKDILPRFAITQPTLSHHLNMMVECGVLNAVKIGRKVRYSVSPERLTEASDFIKLLSEPPIVAGSKKESAVEDITSAEKLALKKTPSVPTPKVAVSNHSLEDSGKQRKKLKADKKKKGKKRKK